MNRFITYSILQYKHSLVLGEAINIGILFYFPDNKHLEFAFSNNTRVKSIYDDFDASLFNSLISTIKAKLKTQNDLFKSSDLEIGLKEYIHNHVLAETESSLQFTEPVITKNTFNNTHDAVNFYSSKLLPGLITESPTTIRHNESFILKSYIGYLFRKNKAEIENKLHRNIEIESEGFTWKFEYGWKANTLNLVKPVSFDLENNQGIQYKSVQLYGYLSLFKSHALRNSNRFDLLISEPQNRNLFKAYDNVIHVLETLDVPKRIIPQADWECYSKETIETLL